MRIALDTNVLVSAYTARGLSADVLRLILAEHDLVISDSLLSEFRRVVTERFGLPVRLVADITEELRLHGVFASGELSSDRYNVIRDLDDRVVVAAAVAGKADVLITGDRDILDVRDDLAEIRVLSPREFWELLRTGGE